MHQHVVVIGSLNLDMVARVAWLPKPGQTVRSLDLNTYPGGKGANQAVAAARLGGRVIMVGRVGEDDAAQVLRQGLAASGVDISRVESSGAATGMALITADQEGENSIVIVEGANGLLRPEDIDRALPCISGAAIVLAQLEIPLPTVERAASLCHEHKIPFMLDPAPAQALPRSLLRRVTWLTPNESESALMLGLSAALPPLETAQRLLALGCRNVALKLGAKGVFLAGVATPPLLIQAFSVPVVDTTAAGDVFNGGFACGLAMGMTPAESARQAAAAAALSVTRPGAQPSMPRGDEVTALLERSSPTTAEL